MSKVYMELICDEDIADELMAYHPDRVDIITYDESTNKIIEMGGEKYREIVEQEDQNGIHEN